MGLLRHLGYDISEGEVTAPAPAACLILRERGLRPHLLVHDGRSAGPWALVGEGAPFQGRGWGGHPSHLGQTTGKDTEVTPGSAAIAHGPVGGNPMGPIHPRPHTRGSLEGQGMSRGQNCSFCWVGVGAGGEDDGAE